MGTIVRFEPAGTEQVVKHPTTILAVAQRAGVHIRTRCSGKAGCLLCKVDVQPTDSTLITLPSEAEQRKLAINLSSSLRLACQVQVTGQQGQVVVQVPEDPYQSVIRKKRTEDIQKDV